MLGKPLCFCLNFVNPDIVSWSDHPCWATWSFMFVFILMEPRFPRGTSTNTEVAPFWVSAHCRLINTHQLPWIIRHQTPMYLTLWPGFSQLWIIRLSSLVFRSCALSNALSDCFSLFFLLLTFCLSYQEVERRTLELNHEWGINARSVAFFAIASRVNWPRGATAAGFHTELLLFHTK